MKTAASYRLSLKHLFSHQRNTDNFPIFIVARTQTPMPTSFQKMQNTSQDQESSGALWDSKTTQSGYAIAFTESRDTSMAHQRLCYEAGSSSPPRSGTQFIHSFKARLSCALPMVRKKNTTVLRASVAASLLSPLSSIRCYWLPWPLTLAQQPLHYKLDARRHRISKVQIHRTAAETCALAHAAPLSQP